ncbi:MAG: HEAT repeat domain-containing protein [Mangrovibacterium sp.]
MNQELINQLQSDNTKEVLQAIELLAIEGKSTYLPLLINLLHSSIDADVVSAITSMLGQLKQQDAVPYLVEAIADENYHDIREELLTVCWENGLSYAVHIDVFIDIMITADFMSAFEAHTLITNMWGKITAEQRAEEEQKIADALLDMNTEKAVLLEEVKDFLYALEEGVQPAEY